MSATSTNESSTLNNLKNMVSNFAKEVTTNPSKVFHDAYNSINQNETARETFVSRMLWGFILFLLIWISIYYGIYLQTLSWRECEYLYSVYGTSNNKYIRSLQAGDPDCKFTLKDYYIKTAFNACSGWNLTQDFVNSCNLKNVLRQGFRCLDFEIYSINDRPIVSTSTLGKNFYVKETYNCMDFADVMNILMNYGFSSSTCNNSTDPIIIHLRLKSTNQDMFTQLAMIFENYDDLMLGNKFSFENHGNNLGDVPLLSLLGKFILIVDRSNLAWLQNDRLREFVNMTSFSVFTRLLRYSEVANTPDLFELKNYNQKNMTLVIPDLGRNPPNPNTIVSREAGCQMVAVRCSYVDPFLEENTFFFDKVGYAFALKPERLRFKAVTINKPPDQDPKLDYKVRVAKSDYYKFDY
jgi:hypothetical protein